MPKHVVVLGAGVSGEAFIAALRRLDKEVRITLVEDELVGGECSYWACIPSKTLLRPVEIAFRAKSAHGVEATLDPEQIFWWRDKNAGPDDSSQVKWVDDLDAELVRGKGRRHGGWQDRRGRERARVRRADGLHGIPADAAADRGPRLRGALAEPRSHERERGSRESRRRRRRCRGLRARAVLLPPRQRASPSSRAASTSCREATGRRVTSSASSSRTKASSSA